MQAESSNIFNEKDNSQTIKIDKEKIICKDGFCSLPGHKESSKTDKNDINLFDPIQLVKVIIKSLRQNWFYIS